MAGGVWRKTRVFQQTELAWGAATHQMLVGLEPEVWLSARGIG